MAADERVTELEEFLARRGRPLLRVAALLGGGPEPGEDLLQAALERLLRHRRRFEGDPDQVSRLLVILIRVPSQGALTRRGKGLASAFERCVSTAAGPA
jgi:DNA-directed RNA polymerase specialized sigma24 family protein